MSLKFQYNKVALQALQKELKMRVNALPTLKSKESHLRMTIKKEKQELQEMIHRLFELKSGIGESHRLFSEFPTDALAVKSIEYQWNNIAGISIPALDTIEFIENSPSATLDPQWLPWGWNLAEKIFRMETEIRISKDRLQRLETARRKTTQKVNLYEKIQIPEFSQGILKIKRYLEDVSNLEKAAQKITKAKQARAAGNAA